MQAEKSFSPFLGEPAEIVQSLVRRKHRGHDRRIRCDNLVLFESLLEAKAGHSESLVLVIAIGVLSRVCRLRDAPGQARFPAILDLPRHGRLARFGQDRARQLRSNSRGMRYSNIVPPQDKSPIPPAALMNCRPSWNQWRRGASPWATAR